MVDTKIKDSEMTKLLDEKQYFNLPKIGDLIKGTIITANKNEAYLDLNGIAAGIVRGRERYSESEEYRSLKAGDEVEATVLEMENENGEMELSFRYAGRQKAWNSIKEKEKEGAIIKVLVTDANKGGLMIKMENTVGFLPVSQLSPEHYPRVPGGDKNRILEILKSYVGKKFETKIIDAHEEDEKLIVSEKAAWEQTQQHVINKYKVGEKVEGTVTAVTDFGVFVEFDQLEGLIHISEIAWQRIDNPSDFVKVGQKVKAEVIGIENSKIFLSMKKLQKDPWEGLEEKYKIDQKISGKVIKANPFGLFVEIAKDIQGLAHISQLSDKSIENIDQIAKTGDELEFYIVSMDSKNHRLGLSLVKPEVTKRTTQNAQQTTETPVKDIKQKLETPIETKKPKEKTEKESALSENIEKDKLVETEKEPMVEKPNIEEQKVEEKSIEEKLEPEEISKQ